MTIRSEEEVKTELDHLNERWRSGEGSGRGSTPLKLKTRIKMLEWFLKMEATYEN